MKGKVVWFDATRGYGFIEPADGGGDIVFSRVASGAAISPGDTVRYAVTDGVQGPEATDVKPAG
ncbi:MAG: cold shock domain-containing protein [Alphaproteobacteria bacterium]|jgi:CspA family cold shock protein